MTRSVRFFLLLVLPTLLFAPADTAAQDLHPSRRPSPVGIAKTFLGDTYVKVTYGRPYLRDRQIFGDASTGGTYLHPFGELWRTGANEATEITVTGPVEVAGQRLPAGTYSIFTVPGADTWEVRFNSELGMDGTGRLGPEGFRLTYDTADDVLVARIPVRTLEEPVEQFTIAFEQGDGGTHMVLRWENTEVPVPIAAAGR
ncbi:MAG TPA: DUF2911 domain-containing protein, partial [Longimicrobiales bacterium]|nr:DUF2911 domain-containing protein [Longimicrobiales bacterium]